METEASGRGVTHRVQLTLGPWSDSGILTASAGPSHGSVQSVNEYEIELELEKAEQSLVFMYIAFCCKIN